MNNCINSTKKTLQILGVPHTQKYIEDIILSHQDHNSLLAISDTLTKYSIENTAVELTKERIDELPSTCIVQVTIEKSTLFYVIQNVGESHVSFYDEKNKLEVYNKVDFQKVWTGICLLFEKTENSKEVGIERKLTVKKINIILISIASILLIFSTALGLSNAEVYGGSIALFYTILYAMLKLIGLALGILLLWFEIDQHNPTLQNFCSGGSKKINCNAVLNSEYATLFKGSLNLSLSTIAFSYFIASLLFLFISGFSSASVSLLSLSSFIVAPVVLVSFYYQAFVIKQWCKFCIIIQVVLLTETLISYLGGFYKNNIALEELPVLIAFFILPILAWGKLKLLFENDKLINFYRRRLNKVKNNLDVFESLLIKSRKITTNTEGLGIPLNGNNTKYDIIKVCSPYCGPCATAHPILEALYANGKINLQIVFAPNENESHPALKPIKHFLAIDSQKNPAKTQQALDDWYNAEQKDYNVFANKYVMNGELEKQKNKLQAMREWCQKEKIKHTPTVFINGHELPDEYQIEDLRDILG